MAEDEGEVPSGNLETQAISFLLDVKSNADEALKKLDAALDSSEASINKRLDRLAIAINENANRQNAIFNRQAEGIEEAVKAIGQLANTLEKKLPTGSDAAKTFADKSGKAMDDTKKKIDEVGDAAVKMADKVKTSTDKAGLSFEELWSKLKKLDVRNTAVGAFAFGAMKHSFTEADRTYEAGATAAKFTQMSEGAVKQRRSDLGDVRAITGETPENLKAINEELAKTEYRGKIAFKPAAEGAIEFNRATGMAVKSSAELYGTLKNTYNLTDAQTKKQMENMAFLAKNSGVSVENYKALTDELKFVKYGLDRAAGSSDAMLKSAVEATATLSRYGGTASDVTRQVKGVTEGGMDAYMKTMQKGIMAGKSVEEIQRIIDKGDAKGLQEIDKGAVGFMSSKTEGLGPGLGGAMGREYFGKEFGMSGAEYNRNQAMFEGREEGQPGAMNQNASPEDREKMTRAAMQEFSSVTEEKQRQLERMNGMLAKTYEAIYDKMLGAARAIGDAGKSFAGSLVGLGPAAQTVIGLVSQVGLLAVLLEKVYAVGKGEGLFGGLFKGIKSALGFGSKAGMVDAAETIAVQTAKPGMFARLATGIRSALGLGSAEGLAAAEVAATKAAPSILARFAPLATGLRTIFSAPFQLALGASMIIFNTINDKLDEWAQKSATFRKFWYGFWDQFGERIELATKLIGDGFEIVKKKATEIGKIAADNVKGVFFGVVDEIKKQFTMLADVAADFFKDLWDKATPKWLGGTHEKGGVVPTAKPEGIARGLGEHRDIPGAVAASVKAGASGGRIATMMPAPGTTDKATVKTATAAAPSAAEGTPSTKTYTKSLEGLQDLAVGTGMHVTALQEGGHNPGSLHAKGQAMDVRTTGEAPQKIESFIKTAENSGFNVRDERTHPSGQAVWSGPHIHTSFGTGTKSGQAAALTAATSGMTAGPSSGPTSPPASVAATQKTVAPSMPAPTIASTAAVRLDTMKSQARAEKTTGQITEGDTMIAGELRRIQGILAEHTRLLGRGMTSAANRSPFSQEGQRHNEIGGGS